MAVLLITHDLGVVVGRTHEAAAMYGGKIVEHAPTELLFNNMAMPYTRALMEAIPRIENPPHTKLRAIGGQPPDLVDLPPGCRFSPRCVYSTDQCLEQEPELERFKRKDHRVACWYPLRNP